MNDDSSGIAKIMLVDDEENILISLSFILEKEGYSVATAKNGTEALELYKSFKPQIILLDVMMPKMDGFTVASKLRSMDEHSEISIIFLTAKGTSQDRQKGYMSGADDYIVKPFDNRSLLEKVAEKVL